MKSEHAFIVERPVANHCPDLFAPEQPTPDLGGVLDRFGERLAKPLGLGLARLVGCEPLQVEPRSPQDGTMERLAENTATPAACFLMQAGDDSAQFLVTMDAEAVLKLVDRTFGGRGEAPDPLPENLPLSAELFLSRMEAMIAQAVGSALQDLDPRGVQPLRRGTSLAMLRPFPAQQTLLLVKLEIQDPDRDPMSLVLAIPPESVARLMAGESDELAAKKSPRRAPGPVDAPFGDVSLTLSATLVDMRFGLARLSSLKPGDVLPVALARSVPLRIRDRIVAHGTVGEVDERVALQITESF